MVLVRASPNELEFSARSSMGAAVFTGILFVVLATLPLVAPGPVTLYRLIFSALMLLIAGAFYLHARPRARSVRIDLAGRRVHSAGGEVPLERARFIALTTGGSPRDQAFRTRYRAELALEDGGRFVLLERSNPALVLADLRKALDQLRIPVRGGWGLPAGAEPWRTDRDVLPPPERNVVIRSRPYDGQLGAAISVLGGALVIGTIVGIMHGARLDKGGLTSGLSWTLSIVTIGILLVLSAVLITDRITAHASVEKGELELQRRALGVPVFRHRIPFSKIRGVHAVGMTPTEWFHVIVDAGDELIAIPIPGARALELANAFAAH